MKTFRSYAIDKLNDHGLWPEEVEAVMQAVVLDPANDAMRDRWDDPINGYPSIMLSILWLTVRTSAAEWLAANKPCHWSRAAFADVPKEPIRAEA
jgi:hypothetical protein